MRAIDRSKRSGTLLPCALVVLQSVLYGFGDPISKLAYDEVPLFTLLTVRYWMAFFTLLLLFGRSVLRELKTASWRSLLPPCLCIATTYLISNLALVLTSATSVAFLRSLSTVVTPLLAVLVFHQRLSRRLLPVYVLVVAGLYLLCGRGGLSGFGVGEICALLSAGLTAGALLFGERSLRGISAAALTTVQAGMSALLALVCALIFEGGVRTDTISSLSWGIIAYLAVLCTAAGYLLQNLAMYTISARTVALLQCLCPVMTAVFSFFLLRERLSAAGLAGTALILTAVAAATRLDTPSGRPPETAA